MSATNTLSIETSQYAEVFSEQNLRHLDETVREVFGIQFGIDCRTLCSAECDGQQSRPPQGADCVDRLRWSDFWYV